MNYYDYDYSKAAMNTNTVSTTMVWIIISIVVAVIGGIALYFTVFSKKNDNKYKGFMKTLYDFFNFKHIYLEDVFKILYLIGAIAITLLSFTYISISFWTFLEIIILGNLSLRISFEFIMLSLEMFHNVKEINDKIKK